MNRRARRRTRQGRGGPLAGGPRWAAFGRGLRRQMRAGSRAAHRRRNELLITGLYAIAGALCLALAALLLTATVAAPPAGADAATPGRGLRGEVIGAVLLGALGVLLLGLAATTLRAWWRRRG